MSKEILAGGPSAQPRFEAPYLEETVRSALGRAVDEAGYSALPGDASTRQYFRVSLKFHDGFPEPHSLILMQLEQPGVKEETDFIRVLKFLKTLDLPVPELFHFDAGRGLLLLQDCGDLTLEAALQSADSSAFKTWYLKAVRLLAEMQCKATRAIGDDCPAYHLHFDVEKLMWEMDFMVEHFIVGLRKIPLTHAVRKRVREKLTALCEILAAQPRVFTHRDYHSRNLMVHDGALVLLDFQDARMGPSQYDLASLLRDSYMRLDDFLVLEMIDAFIETKQALEQRSIDRRDFLRVFDLMSVQRNLKAVGTFAFQSHIKNNNRYLQYIEPTLNYVNKACERQDELKSLRDDLSELIPELSK